MASLEKRSRFGGEIKHSYLSSFDWAFVKDKWPLFSIELTLRAKDTLAVHNAMQRICLDGNVQVEDVFVVLKEEK